MQGILMSVFVIHLPNLRVSETTVLLVVVLLRTKVSVSFKEQNKIPTKWG